MPIRLWHRIVKLVLLKNSVVPRLREGALLSEPNWSLQSLNLRARWKPKKPKRFTVNGPRLRSFPMHG